jgi:hypothetical protein
LRAFEQGNGEEDENNRFEKEDDLEGARVSSILEDIIRHIDDQHSPGNRYIEMTRLWTIEFLRTCGSKALDMVRDQFSVPSRQDLSQRPPSNYLRSDLTDFSLVAERVRTWRNNLRGEIGHKDCPRWILACDALACKPNVRKTTGGLKGIDVSDFDFECDLFDSLLASRKGFLDFVKTHWDRVHHAAFVFQVQPLDPDLRPFIALAQPAVDGKEREQHAQLFQYLRVICGRELITIGVFATNGDSGYDPVHETQARWNLVLFKKNELEMSSKQRYRVISDLLHFLKRPIERRRTASGRRPRLRFSRVITWQFCWFTW